MLQRLTEDLEYHALLDRAAKCENSLEQLCYVAAFTVSSYSTTVYRTSKPFNPLLGETFELDRLEENGYRSLCEQVCRTNSLILCLSGPSHPSQMWAAFTLGLLSIVPSRIEWVPGSPLLGGTSAVSAYAPCLT